MQPTLEDGIHFEMWIKETCILFLPSSRRYMWVIARWEQLCLNQITKILSGGSRAGEKRGVLHTRAEATHREAMSRMFLLLLNLFLPLLVDAQECRLKKDAFELLSVNYDVDPSGSRYFTSFALPWIPFLLNLDSGIFCVNCFYFKSFPGTQTWSQWQWRTEGSTAWNCSRKDAGESNLSLSCISRSRGLNGR